MKSVLTFIFAAVVLAGAVWASWLYLDTFEITHWTPSPITALPPGSSTANPPLAVDISNRIHIREPQSGSFISRPVSVSGEARGNWFFEASFPMKVLDGDGTLLGSGNASAMGEWMTTAFVPFQGIIEYRQPKSTRGIVVFVRDNPSGLPENAAEVQVPVLFKATNAGAPREACHPTGCSGEICSDADAVSVCWFKPEFACYKSAVCERQKTTGKCGWTVTKELTACVKAARSGPIEPL